MDYSVEYQEEINGALEYATKVASAIEKKLGRYTVSVRRHDTSDVCFIEFRLHVPNTAETTDICSAYSVKYLTVTPDQAKERAQKILDNLRTLVGSK